MQRLKVEVATGVVIMDSFYFFAIVLQEGRQAKWIEMADKISSVTPTDYSEKHISFFLCCTDCDMAHVYTHMWWEFLSSIKTYVYIFIST